MKYLLFSIWLSSLSIIPSGFVCVVKNGRISFFLKVEQYFIVYVYLCVCVCAFYILCILSFVDGHLGYFHVLTAVHNAAVNMGCRHLFGIGNLFPLDAYAKVALLGHIWLKKDIGSSFNHWEPFCSLGRYSLVQTSDSQSFISESHGKAC